MYRLVKISLLGKTTEITSDFDKDAMITAGEQLQKKNPADQFAVMEAHGHYVWPERLAKAHSLPDDYDPSQALVPNRYGSVEQ